jgi:hypothetical protein
VTASLAERWGLPPVRNQWPLVTAMVVDAVFPVPIVMNIHLRTFLPVALALACHGAPGPAIGDMPGACLCAFLLWLICLFKPGYFSKVGQGPPDNSRPAVIFDL